MAVAPTIKVGFIRAQWNLQHIFVCSVTHFATAVTDLQKMSKQQYVVRLHEWTIKRARPDIAHVSSKYETN